MSIWQHASLLRLQPHYVYILGSNKGAVTTALVAFHPDRVRKAQWQNSEMTNVAKLHMHLHIHFGIKLVLASVTQTI